MPCNTMCDGEYSAPAGGDDTCLTAVDGDSCYDHVMWAMTTGIADHPDWYPELTADSSFEDFQCHLHQLDFVEHCVNIPCGHTCIPLEPGERCHDTVAEDACFGHIDWAMNTGIVNNPEWYPNLSADSEFKAFQCELALSPDVPDCNDLPCEYECDGVYESPAGGDGTGR